MIPFLLLLPGGLTVYLSFSSGGFYPGATGVAAAALALLLAVRVTTGRRPFEGVGALVAGGACAVALFAVWTLASSGWSDSESRAVLEFDRVLLYGLAFLLLGTVPRTPERVRLALGGVAVAMVVVCLAGFASRALPDLVPVGLNEANSRLSYPVSYWNGMGLLAALAALFSLHLASARGSLVVRAAAGAAVPLALATLLMTFSRGAITAGIAALAIYAVVARGRSLALSAMACLPGPRSPWWPPTAPISSRRPTTPRRPPSPRAKSSR